MMKKKILIIFGIFLSFQNSVLSQNPNYTKVLTTLETEYQGKAIGNVLMLNEKFALGNFYELNNNQVIAFFVVNGEGYFNDEGELIDDNNAPPVPESMFIQNEPSFNNFHGNTDVAFALSKLLLEFENNSTFNSLQPNRKTISEIFNTFYSQSVRLHFYIGLEQYPNSSYSRGSFNFGYKYPNATVPFTEFDVVIHEFGHYITNIISVDQLVGGEPGALNEAFSDVFAEYITQKTAFTAPTLQFWKKWKHGENKELSHYSRSLKRPKDKGLPSTYNGYNWGDPTKLDKEHDFGSVHKNSTVASHFFYNLSEGWSSGILFGLFNSHNGIGLDKAFDLYYNTWVSYNDDNNPTPMTYQSFANAMICKTKVLFPNDSEVQETVVAAWQEAGISVQCDDIPFSPIDVTIIPTQPTFNTANGKITVTANQGTNYNYSWTPTAGNVNEITGLSAGYYVVTITDPASNLQQVKNISLDNRVSFKASIQSFASKDCGSPNGQAQLSIKDKITNQNIPNLVILWKDSNGNQLTNLDNMVEATGLAPGDYSVEIVRYENGAIESKETIPFTIDLDSPSVLIGAGGHRTLCTGMEPNVWRLYPSINNCDDCIITEWTTEDGQILSTGDNNLDIHVPVQDADYTMHVQYGNGCSLDIPTELRFHSQDCTECDDGSFRFVSFTGVDPCKEFTLDILEAYDPNAIVGPPGYDEAHWVSVDDILPYTIQFENHADSASAAARRVEIVHYFDEHEDPLSLKLGNFNFAGMDFTVPPNKNFYSTRLDVQDSLGVFVDVTAGIDVTANKAFWILEAIDPTTGLPPLDPAKGLLPINDTITHKGEGYVSFTVRPKKNSLTRDTIFAKASIIFDQNEAIETNTVFNVIDAFAPTTIVDTLPENIDTTSFFISWSGSDDTDGCGIQSYNVFVAEGERAFTLYRENVLDTFTEVIGYLGDELCVYVEAIDHVGNREEKTSGDACTTLGGDIVIAAKVFLEGAYNTDDGLMTDGLRTGGYLPLHEPYSGLGFQHFGHGGEEMMDTSVLLVSGADAIVDWIFLEVRSSADPTNIIATRSALLQRDGDIVDIDGVSAVKFYQTYKDSFYVAIRHRNHFGVRTNDALYLTRAIDTPIDFTDINTATYGTNPQKEKDSVLVLIAGDANKDGQINAVDKNAFWRVQNGQAFDYLNFTSDFNLDGAINAVDKNAYWRINNSKIEQLD